MGVLFFLLLRYSYGRLGGSKSSAIFARSSGTVRKSQASSASECTSDAIPPRPYSSRELGQGKPSPILSSARRVTASRQVVEALGLAEGVLIEAPAPGFGAAGRGVFDTPALYPPLWGRLCLPRPPA